jgi:mannose-6-phosphate isomerase-like protein (cupin superfamily)
VRAGAGRATIVPVLDQASPSPPVTISILAGGEATDGAYAVIDIRARAGFALPPHVLCRDEAKLVVIAGTVDVDLGDESLRLEGGEHRVLPAAVPRSLRVVADARVVAVLVPAGLERLLRVIGPPLPDPEDLAAHLAAARVTLLPPCRGGRTAVARR